jgi:hypothetical protein
MKRAFQMGANKAAQKISQLHASSKEGKDENNEGTGSWERSSFIAEKETADEREQREISSEEKVSFCSECDD